MTLIIVFFLALLKYIAARIPSPSWPNWLSGTALASERSGFEPLGAPHPGGGTLKISVWGCAARTLEPLAYTRASFSWILLPYTRVNSWFP